MKKNKFFQKIPIWGILIIGFLSGCNSSVFTSLSLDDGNISLVSYTYNWEKSVVQDTTFLSCKQTIVYSASGSEITLTPSAWVKLWTRLDTVALSSDNLKPSIQKISSTTSSNGNLPTQHRLKKSFELDDNQTIVAEILYEDFSTSSQETSLILPCIKITDLSFLETRVVPHEHLADSYTVTVAFDVPWKVLQQEDNASENIAVSYVKSASSVGDDNVTQTSYQTGVEWIDKSSFKLFVDKIENETTRNRIYSQALSFSLKTSDKPSLMVNSLNFATHTSSSQSESEIICSDVWNIQKKLILKTVLFDNGTQNFTHSFEYPLYEASVMVDNQKVSFNLEALFDVQTLNSQFGDSSKKITSSATLSFANKLFEADTSTLLILNSHNDSDEDADVNEGDNSGNQDSSGENTDNPNILKYGRIIDFRVTAVLNVDGLSSGTPITQKAVVIRFEEGYYFGICNFKENFPTQFTYTLSGYSGFNSAAQPKAGKPFRIARAVVADGGIKWMAEDNSLIMGIDFLSCGIYGWENIVKGAYSAFIDTYSSSYTADRYSLTLTAPDGNTLTIKSSPL